jgi:DNA invertase Pin-like site-specific DNA recombinase
VFAFALLFSFGWLVGRDGSSARLVAGLLVEFAGAIDDVESIGTSGPAGRMLMQMLGSFAEFEREMMRGRTRAGLHEARAQGRVPGRKPKITPEQKKEIVEAVASGRKTPAEIARLLMIHRGTVSRIVSQARVGV